MGLSAFSHGVPVLFNKSLTVLHQNKQIIYIYIYTHTHTHTHTHKMGKISEYVFLKKKLKKIKGREAIKIKGRDCKQAMAHKMILTSLGKCKSKSHKDTILTHWDNYN
jgi:hypothetical protein